MTNASNLSSDTEVLGQMVIDFENAINSNSFKPILEKHNLNHVKADEWYSGQKWLAVLNDIKTDSSFLNLVSIGIEQIKHVEWPPEFSSMSFEDVLVSLNPIYQSYYRGSDIGEVQFEKVNDYHFRIILRVFEPDDLWYGNIYQIARTFDTPSTAFTLAYDEEITRKDMGGDYTVLNIHFDQS